MQEKKYNMKCIKAIWQFCTYLFVPQMGRQRRKKEELKKQITYIIGKERSEGFVGNISSEYISRALNVPRGDVEICMKEMSID